MFTSFWGMYCIYCFITEENEANQIKLDCTRLHIVLSNLVPYSLSLSFPLFPSLCSSLPSHTGGKIKKQSCEKTLQITPSPFKYSWTDEAKKLFCSITISVPIPSSTHVSSKHLLSDWDPGEVIHFHLNQLFQITCACCIYQRKIIPFLSLIHWGIFIWKTFTCIFQLLW